MINNKFLENKHKEYLILLIIFFISFLFRYHDLMMGSLYMDEMDTFYISDPNISFYETFHRILAIEQYNFFHYLYKIFFILFGYTDYNARLLTCITGSIIPLATYKLYKDHISNKNKFFLITLLILNFYLIYKSQEVRAQVFYCLFVILNIYYFLEVLKNKNLFNISLYIFFGLISLLTMNFSIIVIFSQFIFLLFKKKYFLNFFAYMSIMMILFVFLNFAHIEKQFFLIANPNFDVTAIKSLTFTTFYDIFFRYYFGSRVSGIIVLIFLIYLIFREIYEKKIKINENILFLLILLFFTYLIPVVFSIFISPILLPRYIIYVVPIIIIIISALSINKKKLSYGIFLIMFLILNANTIYQKFYLKKFTKPNYNKVFQENNINNQIVYIYGFQTIILKNLLENSLLNYNLVFGDEKDLKNTLPKEFIGLCRAKEYTMKKYDYEMIKIYESKFLLENYYKFCLYEKT
jgi:hypothetical protein